MQSSKWPEESTTERTKAADAMLVLAGQSSPTSCRKKREFTPDDQKDSTYWLKRQKNNEAARKSREKRRACDNVLGSQINQLTTENSKLKDELTAIRKRFGLGENKIYYTADTSSSNTSSSSASPIVFASTEHQQELQPVLPLSPSSHQVVVLSRFSPEGRSASSESSILTTSPAQVKYTSTPLRIPEYQPMFSLGSQSSKMSTLSRPQCILPISDLSPAKSHLSYPQSPQLSSSNAGDTLMSLESKIIQKVSDLDSQMWKPSNGATISLGTSISVCKKQQLHIDTQSPSMLCLPNPLGAAQIHVSSSPGVSGTMISPNQGLLSLNIPAKNSFFMDRSFENLAASAHSVETSIQPQQIAKRHSSSLSLHISLSASDGSADELEVKKEDTCAEECGEYDFNRAMKRKSVPHKLRHKTSLWGDETLQGQSDEEQAASSSGSSSGSGDLPIFRSRYAERRYRNNLAAKKCRDNRRQINNVRQQKSDLLEKENDKLRKELSYLEKEITTLKELLLRKQNAQMNGDLFEPPPLENVSASSFQQNNIDSS